MSVMTGQFDADVAAIELELPAYLLWMGKTLIGSQNAIDDRQDMADAGLIQLYDFEWVGRVSLFAGVALPVKNDEVKIQDRDKNFISHRVDKITMSQDGVCITLGCVQLN